MPHRLLMLAAAAVVAASAAAAPPLFAEHEAEPAEAEQGWPGRRLSAEVVLEDARLDEAIDQLQEAAGVGCFVNWPELEEVGVGRDARVNLSLPADLSATLAMRALVLRASAATGQKLDVEFSDGIATISTRNDLNRNVQTQVFDVRDLVPAGESRSSGEALLAELIQSTIEPDAWQSNGGDVGRMAFLNAQIVVTATGDMLPQIERLLADLRGRAAAE